MPCNMILELEAELQDLQKTRNTFEEDNYDDLYKYLLHDLDLQIDDLIDRIVRYDEQNS